MVMQFHGVIGTKSLPNAVSLYEELKYRVIGLQEINYLCVYIQLLEAVNYLHSSAFILHNDIKTDNILIDKALGTVVNDEFDYTAVLILFW